MLSRRLVPLIQPRNDPSTTEGGRTSRTEPSFKAEADSSDERQMRSSAAVALDPLDRNPRQILTYLKTSEGKKALRYAAVSVVAIVVSQITIGVSYGGFHSSKTMAQTAAAVLSTIPSYILNRRWVWGRNGKSSASKEIVPFWVISIVQFIISLVAINWLGSWMERHVDSHALRTICLQFIVLFIYGVMWIGKFVFFNKVLFADRTTPAV